MSSVPRASKCCLAELNRNESIQIVSACAPREVAKHGENIRTMYMPRRGGLLNIDQVSNLEALYT